MLLDMCHFINSFSVKLYFVLKNKYHLFIETIHCVIQEILMYLLTAYNSHSTCFGSRKNAPEKNASRINVNAPGKSAPRKIAPRKFAHKKNTPWKNCLEGTSNKFASDIFSFV